MPQNNEPTAIESNSVLEGLLCFETNIGQSESQPSRLPDWRQQIQLNRSVILADFFRLRLSCRYFLNACRCNLAKCR